MAEAPAREHASAARTFKVSRFRDRSVIHVGALTSPQVRILWAHRWGDHAPGPVTLRCVLFQVVRARDGARALRALPLLVVLNCGVTQALRIHPLACLAPRLGCRDDTTRDIRHVSLTLRADHQRPRLTTAPASVFRDWAWWRWLADCQRLLHCAVPYDRVVLIGHAENPASSNARSIATPDSVSDFKARARPWMSAAIILEKSKLISVSSFSDSSAATNNPRG